MIALNVPLLLLLYLSCCSLLAGVPVVYTGDPLRDLGTTAFLDKFVNKKPKVCLNCTRIGRQLHGRVWSYLWALSCGLDSVNQTRAVLASGSLRKWTFISERSAMPC